MTPPDKNTIYDALQSKDNLLLGSQDELVRTQLKNDCHETLMILQEGKENTAIKLKEKNRFFIGSSPTVDLKLDIPDISESQLALVRMGNKWLFMDRGDKDLALFNGSPRRQKIFHQSQKVHCKIGKTWILYLGSNSPEPESQQPEAPHLEIQIARASHKSYSAPLLIGRHPACDIKINSDNAKDFEALIYWNLHGIFLEKLPNSNSIKYNFQMVKEKIELDHNGFFCIGEDIIQFKLNGLIAYQINQKFGEIIQSPKLAFTSITNGEEELQNLELYKSYLLGRGSDSDLTILHPSISRHHAIVTLKNKSLLIKDNNSYNKTFLNGEEISSCEARAGDIVTFGELPLLAHYDTKHKSPKTPKIKST